jgi:hypothetical protein
LPRSHTSTPPSPSSHEFVNGFFSTITTTNSHHQKNTGETTPLSDVISDSTGSHISKATAAPPSSGSQQGRPTCEFGSHDEQWRTLPSHF